MGLVEDDQVAIDQEDEVRVAAQVRDGPGHVVRGTGAVADVCRRTAHAPYAHPATSTGRPRCRHSPSWSGRRRRRPGAPAATHWRWRGQWCASRGPAAGPSAAHPGPGNGAHHESRRCGGSCPRRRGGPGRGQYGARGRLEVRERAIVTDDPLGLAAVDPSHPTVAVDGVTDAIDADDRPKSGAAGDQGSPSARSR